MATNAKAIPQSRPMIPVKEITTVGMMIALTIIMCLTPLGIVTLPMIRITIAHIPILITAILFGLPQGLMVAGAFGVTSLLIALTAPASLLDPFFVNPLVSVLPRLLIPVTTYGVYRGLTRLAGGRKGGDVAAVAVSLAVGNLTNTFGVYAMLYLIYAGPIMEATGTPALTLIIGLISTTTLIKCTAIVLVCTPVVLALKKALRRSITH